VAVLARESPDLRSIADELDDLGAECVVAPCDVRDAGSVERSIAHVEQELGGIDVLVNNAGGGRYALFGELTEKDWDDMLSLNVVGMVSVTRAVLPHMQSRGRGHIINISSIRGLEGAATMTAYTASKFAVTGLTRALRQELDGSGVLVSLVSRPVLGASAPRTRIRVGWSRRRSPISSFRSLHSADGAGSPRSPSCRSQGAE
jgi:NADP-dependent 3-hydroxy acid dehydrogenase YdfG